MELKEKFEAAAVRVKGLTKRPSNEELLDMYGLYKQGQDGDVSGKKPGMFDIKGQAKYKAWEKNKGVSKEDAQQRYIDLVETLLKKYA